MKKFLVLTFSMILLNMIGCTNVEKINKELNIQTIRNYENVKIPGWRIVSIVDEFREPTGKTRIITDSRIDKSSLYIETTEEKWNSYMISIVSDEFIGGQGIYNETTIRIKIDNNEPIILYHSYVTSSNLNKAYSYMPKELLQQMLNGKKMKVSIERYDYRDVYTEFDLTYFKEAIKYLL